MRALLFVIFILSACSEDPEPSPSVEPGDEPADDAPQPEPTEEDAPDEDAPDQAPTALDLPAEIPVPDALPMRAHTVEATTITEPGASRSSRTPTPPSARP